MDNIKGLSHYFNGDGKVTVWPSKRKNKLLVLEYLASKLELGVFYSEREINEILNGLHTFGDHALLRRELFDHRYVNRTNDCKSYWKAEPALAQPTEYSEEQIVHEAIR